MYDVSWDIGAIGDGGKTGAGFGFPSISSFIVLIMISSDCFCIGSAIGFYYNIKHLHNCGGVYIYLSTQVIYSASFKDKLILPPSILFILTFTSSPTLTTSVTFSTRRFANSEI